MLQIWIPIDDISNKFSSNNIYSKPHSLIYLSLSFFPIIWSFTKSPKYYPFQMWNLHQNLSLNQLLFILFANLPHQCTNLLLVLDIILWYIIPVLLPFTWKTYLPIHLEVRVFLFPRLFLQHIHCYLLYKTQNNIIQTNTHLLHKFHLLQQQDPHQQLIIHLHIISEFQDYVFSLLANLFFRRYKREQTTTRIFDLTTITLNL